MHRITLATFAWSLLVAPFAQAVDLNGAWHVGPPGIGSPITTMFQAGNDVSILGLYGTLTPGSPFSSYAVSASFPPSGEASLVGRVMPSENLMDGRGISFDTGGITILSFLFNRCACNDGNQVNGDGCDAECRVEPCWTCSGDPSVCTPKAPGAACDDRNPCTTGEFCSGLSCGGGSAVPSCVNMAGFWSRFRVIDGAGHSSGIELRQFDTDVVGALAGTIDPSTGAFDVRSPNLESVFCPAFDTLVGTVAPDGMSYTATGFVGVPQAGVGDQCDLLPVTEVGTRCIDSCPPTTTSTSTSTSTTTSTTLPSGTVCQLAPLAGCRQPIAPRKAKLSLADRTPDHGDAVAWKWTKGAATTLAEFGDPTSVTSYVACLYDGDVLRMTLRMPAGGTCAARPCWKASAKGFTYVHKDGVPDGVRKVSLLAGTAGKAKITLTAKHGPVPMPVLGAFAAPVRFQLQSNDGCWEAVYGTPQVSTPELYRATSD